VRSRSRLGLSLGVVAVLAAMAVAIVAVGPVKSSGASGAGARHDAARHDEPRVPPGWLLEEARDAVRMLDDPHPVATYWGRVTAGDLAEFTGDEPENPAIEEYVVILSGSFSTRTLSHPAGGSFPGRGTTAWFQYCTDTHECLASGMSWGEPRTPVIAGIHPFELSEGPTR
jgi:hypothetical protein